MEVMVGGENGAERGVQCGVYFRTWYALLSGDEKTVF